MVMERLKARSYGGLYARDYFWRTWERQKIDLLEEYGGSLHAFEFKWSPRKKSAPPKVFMAAYPGSSCKTVSQENFLEEV
jgi:hypothetical protein